MVVKRNTVPIIIAVSISVLIVLCLFDRSLVGGIVLSTLSTALSNDHITTSIASGALSVWGSLGLVLTGVKIQGTSLFLPALLDTVNLQCSPVSVFSKPRCFFSGTLYGGNVSGEVFYTNRENFIGSADIKNLSLASHPLLHGFGIENGKISLNTINFEHSESKNQRRVSMEVHLENLEKPIQSKLSPSISGLPFPIDIPPLSIGDLKATVVGSNESVLIQRLRMESSVGKVEGNGSIQVHGNRFRIETMSFVFTPTDSGRTIMSQYLQFICPREVLAAPVLVLTVKETAYNCRRQS